VIAVIAAIIGAALTIGIQSILSRRDETQRIAELRNGLYQALAEIWALNYYTTENLDFCRKRKDEEGFKAVLSQYQIAITVPRYDVLLKKAQEERTKLLPVVDVLQEILSVVASNRGFRLLLELQKKINKDLELKRLDEDEFNEHMLKALREDLVAEAQEIYLSVETQVAELQKLGNADDPVGEAFEEELKQIRKRQENRAMYVGGTVTSIKEQTEGMFSTNDEKMFAFTYKDNKLEIPYDKVNDLEYGQTAGRRLPLGLAISPLLSSKKRKNYFTIGYNDKNDQQQAAFSELGKNIVRTTLASVELHTGKKIDYQDEEARKSGEGN